jgi:acetyl-CoA carboxylase carboxyl transferase subunit beta
MAWFKRKRSERKPNASERPQSPVPKGLWTKCDGCKEVIYTKELEKNLWVCPRCGYHTRIDATERIRLLLDEDEPNRLFTDIRPSDPLGFRDSKKYKDRLKTYQKALGEHDAAVVTEGHLDGVPVVMAVMEYRFMGGSMGSVVAPAASPMMSRPAAFSSRASPVTAMVGEGLIADRRDAMIDMAGSTKAR